LSSSLLVIFFLFLDPDRYYQVYMPRKQQKVVASLSALEESTRVNVPFTPLLPALEESAPVVDAVPTTPTQMTSTVEAAVASTIPSPVLSPAFRRVMAEVE
jgi:hypothetical protein